MANVVAVIPARSGSSVVDKNIKLLGGYPLIAYSIAAAKLASGIDRIIVSTDSNKYASIASKYGAEVPFLRPTEISGDNSTDYEWIKHLLDWMQNKENFLPSYLVHLRPTTPLREIKIIDYAIKYMMKNIKATALRSAHKTHLTPYKMFKLNGEYMKPFLSCEGVEEFYNLPRQFFEDAYIPNGYIDIIRPSVFMNTGLLHGDRIKLWETDVIPDIDTIADFNFAENILCEEKYKKIMDYLKDKINE
ncbi:8-amino-3,8-dideoxy-manno-octulosonate cytidylyltransferase [subsurface metagenome]